MLQNSNQLFRFGPPIKQTLYEHCQLLRLKIHSRASATQNTPPYKGRATATPIQRMVEATASMTPQEATQLGDRKIVRDCLILRSRLPIALQSFVPAGPNCSFCLLFIKYRFLFPL